MYLFKERISVDSCESEGTFMANLPLHDLQSKQGEVESSHSKEKYPRWLYVELAGLCVVMAIIWGLMTIPIILYYIPVTVVSKMSELKNNEFVYSLRRNSLLRQC